MTMMLSAFRPSTMSVMACGVCAAAIARMKRSTFSGSDAMSGTHRHPSIRVAARLHHVDPAAVEPFADQVVEDDAAGVELLGHADDGRRRGSSRCCSLPSGRAGRRGPRARAELDQDVERDEPPAGDDERVDLALGDRRAGANSAASAMNRSTAVDERGRARSAAPGRAGRPVASRPTASRPTASSMSASVVTAGEKIADLAPRLEVRREELGVDAARAERHDRPEVVGPPQAEEELAAERRVVSGRTG